MRTLGRLPDQMRLNQFLRFHVFCTFLLIIAGGLVTSTDSGLAVPDWPKSYGTWMPPMVGGIFYEHGHRMVAAFVGLLTAILALWFFAREKRTWVRRLGYIALLSVIVQGVLGGITVLYLLPTPISVMHATLAQTFFSLIVCLALFTSKSWSAEPAEIAVPAGTRALWIGAVCAVYVQLILGAWMRHSGAELAIPDFPLAFGRLIPAFATPQIAIHFAHRVWAIVVFILVCLTFVSITRNFRHTDLYNPALLLLFLVFVQIGLGGLTVLSRVAVPITTAHVAVGALILATSVVVAVRSYRIHIVLEPAASAVAAESVYPS
jgi:heme a synthase